MRPAESVLWMRCSAGERWERASSAAGAGEAAELGVEEYGLDARGRRRGAAERKAVRGEDVAARREVRGRARAKREKMRGVDIVVFISSDSYLRRRVVEMCNPMAFWGRGYSTVLHSTFRGIDRGEVFRGASYISRAWSL